MSRRFFSPAPIRGPEVRLTGSEAHHLTHVLRAQSGDSVILFDGSGWEFTARVGRMQRHGVVLEVVHQEAVCRESPTRLVLGVAFPKGDRQKWLIEKAVELGVACLVPLRTERGVAQPGARALDRAARGVVEASKQCGRNLLMEVGPAMDVGEFVSTADPEGARWWADPTASSGLPDRLDGETHVVAVGPEGGFTEEESRHAREHGWQAVALGPRTLRTETAALTLAALCLGRA